MQGDMCRITTLGGRSPPDKRDDQAVKDMKKGYAWIDMRQDRVIWMITQSQGASIKLKKASKTHENAITT